MRISRYSIPLDNDCAIALPEGYQVIKIAWSDMHNEASLWAIVDPDAAFVMVHLAILTEGGNIPSGVHSCLGSVETPAGLVCHVFKHHD
jgi:hypothetical protein